MINIYYINGQGQRIDFDNKIYSIAEMQVYGHNLNYESENEKITHFVKGISCKFAVVYQCDGFKSLAHVTFFQSVDVGVFVGNAVLWIGTVT